MNVNALLNKIGGVLHPFNHDFPRFIERGQNFFAQATLQEWNQAQVHQNPGIFSRNLPLTFITYYLAPQNTDAANLFLGEFDFCQRKFPQDEERFTRFINNKFDCSSSINEFHSSFPYLKGLAENKWETIKNFMQEKAPLVLRDFHDSVPLAAQYITKLKAEGTFKSRFKGDGTYYAPRKLPEIFTYLGYLEDLQKRLLHAKYINSLRR